MANFWDDKSSPVTETASSDAPFWLAGSTAVEDAPVEPLKGGRAPRSAREAEPSDAQKKAAAEEWARGLRARQSGLTAASDTFGRGIARSVPFAHQIGSALDYTFGTGAGAGQPSYEDTLRRNRALSAVDDEQRFKTGLAGQLLGGVALPVGGLAAQGVSGAAKVGGIYGGLYGAAEGESIPDAAGKALTGAGLGAALGAGAGAAAPYVAKGASAVAEPVGRTMGALAERVGLRQPTDPHAVGVAAVKEALSPDTIADAGARVGVEVPRFIASDSRIVQRAAQGARNVIGAGEPVIAATRKLADDLGGAVEKRAGDLGAVSQFEAGEAARRGLAAWNDAQKARIGAAYDAVDAFVDPAISAPLSATKALVAELAAARQAAGMPQVGGASGLVMEAISRPEGLTYQGAKFLRTRVGEALETPSALQTAGVSQGELKRIYGALSDDLKGIVEQAGGADASDMLRVASALNAKVSSLRERLEPLLSGASNESVAAKLASAARSTGRPDIELLTEAKRALGASGDAWNSISGSILTTLGRDAEGAFSPQRFVTAYGKMTPEAKAILFEGQIGKDLDDIARVASRSAETYRQFGNPSGTAQNTITLGMGAGLLAEPLTTVATLGGARLVASVLSRPAAVSKAAQWSNAVAAASQPNANASAGAKVSAAILDFAKAARIPPDQLRDAAIRAAAMQAGRVSGGPPGALPKVAQGETGEPVDPNDNPTVAETFGRALKLGARRGAHEVAQTAAASVKGLEGVKDWQEPKDPAIDRISQQGWRSGLTDPRWIAAKVGEGMGGSAPTLAGGLAGAGAGSLVAPGVGTVVGGAGGAMVAAAVQALAPSYARARAMGMAHDAAVNVAMGETVISGGAGAAGAVAPIFRVAKGPISNLLAQLFVVQPGIGAAEQAGRGAVSGRGITADELIEGYVSNAGAGAAMHGGMSAAHRAGQAFAARRPPPAPPRARIEPTFDNPFDSPPDDGGSPPAGSPPPSGPTPPPPPAPAGGRTAAPLDTYGSATGALSAPIREPMAAATRPNAFEGDLLGARRESGELPVYDARAARAPARGEPAGVYTFDAGALRADAKRFQYKADGDAAGVLSGGDGLKSVNRWDRAKAGQAIVYEDHDGALYVVDGHQRAGLARRIKEGDPQAQTPIAGLLLRSRDGVTATQARTIAALKNIAEGSGTTIDAAKELRANPLVFDDGSMPLSRQNVQEAKGLAALGDEAFGMVVNDVVSPGHGAIVGHFLGGDLVRQEAAMRLLAKADPRSAAEARALVEQVRAEDVQTTPEGDLFGGRDIAESLVLEKARIVGEAQRALGRDRAAFGSLVRNAEKIEDAGNVLAGDANASRQTEANALSARIDAEAYRKGPVSDALTYAAQSVRAGEPARRAAERFLAAVRSGDAEAARPDRPEGGGGQRPADAPRPAGGLPQPEPESVRRPVETGPATAGDGSKLPGGWQQGAAENSIITNTDPVSGGIIDRNIKTGKWFIIPSDPSISELGEFPTRARALDALARAVEARKRAASAGEKTPPEPQTVAPGSEKVPDAAPPGEKPPAPKMPETPENANLAVSGAKRPPTPTVETTPAGQQTVIPGAERAPDANLAQIGADRPLKPPVPQKDTDGLPLMNDSAKQGDLVDAIKTAADAVKPPAEPQAKVGDQEPTLASQPSAEGAARDLWGDGRWKARVGDHVYQTVPGPFGMPASIRGTVEQGKGGLRVRVEAAGDAMGIGQYRGRSVLPYDSAWTVVDDPEPGRRRKEASDKEQAERDKFDAFIADELKKTADDVEAAVASGHARLTAENAKPGLVVINYSYGDHRGKRHYISEIGNDGTVYSSIFGVDDEVARSRGGYDTYSVPMPEQIVPLDEYGQERSKNHAGADAETGENISIRHMGKVSERDAMRNVRLATRAGQYRVVRTTHKPWSVDDFFGSTMEEAEANARKSAEQAADRPITPQVSGPVEGQPRPQDAAPPPAPDASSISWADAKPGDTLPSGEKVIARGVKTKAEATEIAGKAPPGKVRSLVGDGQGRWAVTERDGMTGAQAWAKHRAELVEQGRKAAEDGKGRDDFPADLGQDARAAWREGWDAHAAEKNAASDALAKNGQKWSEKGKNPARFDPKASPADAIADHFARGNSFDTIVQARKFIDENGGKGLSVKQIDEAIEHGVVKVARDIAARETDPAAAYDALVDLYGRQPRLGARTSTSIEQQAYSTPAPLAYLASRAAGINAGKTVYEPSAGNGMLLIGADPAKVKANEINGARAAVLRAQGFKVTQFDASKPGTARSAGQNDVVIANPPFGAVKDDAGVSRRFDMGDIQRGYETNEIDHAIALRALTAMKDDGAAVLILGGVNKLAASPDARADAYNGKAKREFYKALYDRYNVVDHYTAAGELYAKQGAGWPVDVIVIKGRGKSALPLPAVKAPEVYATWDALKGKLDAEPIRDGASPPGATGGEPGEQAPRPAGGRAQADDAGDRGGVGSLRGPDGRPPERPAPDIRPRPDREPVPVDDGGRPAAGAGDEVRGDREPAGSRPVAAPDGGERAGLTPAPVADGATQAPYTPKATGAKSFAVLTPANMRDATQGALTRLAERRGDLTDYAAQQVGMSRAEMTKVLMAEQIDALAMAIDNLQRGSAFIIGDQTGIGKGRVNAMVIRHAIHKGLVPVFVTEKPNLYGDMWRDMIDTGLDKMLGRDPRILMTNSDKKIATSDAPDAAMITPLDGGGKAHNAALMEIARGNRAIGADMVFTTYNQMQTVKGADTERRHFIKSIADKAILIFDESHNAGGQAKSDDPRAIAAAAKKGPDRAEFARDIAQKAKGVFFSSATFAKNPDVMSLYGRTDMRLAVAKIGDLASAIKNGGVPLQEAISSMLAQAGQYVRRERSFEGISYETPVVPFDRAIYNDFSSSLGAIHRFSQIVKRETKQISQQIRNEASTIAADTAVGTAGAESTNFTSIMHNVINQMILAAKADKAADMAIEALKNGEKPVLTVSATMESFLSHYAEAGGVGAGMPMNGTFRDVLLRYLDRTREIRIKKAHGEPSEKYYLTDADLGPEGVVAYRSAKALIHAVNLGDLPLSPIDHIHKRIADAGYASAEITGRELGIDYSGNEPKLRARPQSEIDISGRQKAISRFNAGSVDVLVLNRSGATGLSIHAGEKFKDQRQRHMILVQPEENIDTHMQTLGRVNRSGQVILPRYSQLTLDIPAERRPAAILAKKMASLNAATTSSRKGAMQTDAAGTDFMNVYGDMAAAQWAAENPDIASRLDLSVLSKGDETTGFVRKVTGRIPLVDVDAQERIYADLGERYEAIVKERTEAGENLLEAQFLPLDARTVDRIEAVPGKSGDSPFAAPVYAETIDTKRLRPTTTSAQARSLLAEHLEQDRDASMATLRAAAAKKTAAVKRATLAALDAFKAETMRDLKDEDAAERFDQKIAVARQQWSDAADLFAPGSFVTIEDANGQRTGMVLSFKRETRQAKSPLASWAARVVVPGEGVETISLSRLIPDQNGEASATARRANHERDDEFFQRVDVLATEGRQKRVVLTGNMLAAFAYANGKGQIVRYTTSDGERLQGILMPADKKSASALVAENGKNLSDPQSVAYLVADTGRVQSDDAGVTLEKSRYSDDINISVEKSKASGGAYFLNKELRAIVGDFVSRGGMMVAIVSAHDASRAIDVLMKIGARFKAPPAKGA